MLIEKISILNEFLGFRNIIEFTKKTVIQFIQKICKKKNYWVEDILYPH